MEPFSRPYAEVVPPPPNFLEDHFDSEPEKVDAFHRRVSEMSSRERNHEVIKVLLRALNDSKVGKYSNFHDNAVYAYGYDDPRSILLAYLCVICLRTSTTYTVTRVAHLSSRFTTLLDSNKSGLRLKPGIFERHMKSFDRSRAPCMNVKDQEQLTPHLRRQKDLPIFVLDHLQEAGGNFKDERLAQYDQLKAYGPAHDEDLSTPWNRLCSFATTMARPGPDKPHSTPVFLDEVGRVREFVKELFDEWRRTCSSYHEEKRTSPRKKTKQSPSNRRFTDIAKRFADGPKDIPCLEESNKLDIVMASCLYDYATKNGVVEGKSLRFPFQVALSGLCRIKADASEEGVVSIIRSIADSLKANPAMVRVRRNRQAQDSAD